MRQRRIPPRYRRASRAPSALPATTSARSAATAPVIALDIKPGAAVEIESRPAVIERIVDLNCVLIRPNGARTLRSVGVESLRPSSNPDAPAAVPDLSSVAPKAWALALSRYEAIRPLLDSKTRTRAKVSRAARAYGCSVTTLYAWLRQYTREGRVTALLPQARSDRGRVRLAPAVDAIIVRALETQYLTPQKRRAAQVYREIARLCHRAGLAPPHENTIRARIAALAGELKVRSREGRAAAEGAFTLSEGSVPGVDAPLAVVQIDHTQVDVILVDDILRRPIGRPWITLAIDIYSRMVVGFYISFDPPGALATGLCIAHAVLPKSGWLTRLEVEGEWPCWGPMRKLHLDNAREFHGLMLERACAQYGIEIDWRPVKTPRYGGHIERLLGTFATEIHTLPGTTFSNPKARGEYDSEGRAALTLGDFERWLTTLIVQIYHERVHSTLGVTPMERFRTGILGTDGQGGNGLPPRIVDEERLRLDFMPFVERTIQDYGVMIDWITYSHAVLRPWVGAKSVEDASRKRPFTFRRDPRDLSVVWFYDPELQAYFPIPYRDTSRPPISLWELREARRALANEGAAAVDGGAIFSAYERLRVIEAQAQLRTKAARRAQQRRAAPAEVPGRAPPAARVTPEPLLPSHIRPFDELEELP